MLNCAGKAWDWGVEKRPSRPRSPLEGVVMVRAARALRAALALERIARARRAQLARRLLALAARAGDGFYMGLARAQLASAGRPTLIKDQANGLLEAAGAFFEEGAWDNIALRLASVSELLGGLEGHKLLDAPPDLPITRARLGAPHAALTPRLAPTPALRPHLARAA
ncbi:MAG: hypothetical protein ACOZAQ_06720 [Pseudomonadota bacterium]